MIPVNEGKLKSIRRAAAAPLAFFLLFFLNVQTFAVHDYREALYLTGYFYGAQRCGDTGSWIHGACHVKDAASGNDLTGGWHDCGDHVLFGQTAPYSAGVLLEGYVNFPASYEDRYSANNSAPPANGIPDILDEVKIMTDWLIKAHTGSGFYYQKGNGDYDHKHMCEPVYYSNTYNVNDGGEKDGPRPMSFCSGGGRNVAGDSAAALALMAIAYQPYDAAYATACYNKAKNYIATGEAGAGTVSGQGYYGASNSNDDMAWGCAAIARAAQFRGNTADKNTYQTKALGYVDTGDFQQAGYWPLCYDHTEELAWYELYKLTGTTSYRTNLSNEVTYYRGKMVTCGIGQYAFVTDWGSLRYAGNMAFVAMLYYDISNDAAALDFAKKNIDFILGTHGDIAGSPGAPAGRSFVVGYTNPDYASAGSVQHPHHRAAFGRTSDADTKWVQENTSPGSVPYLYQLKGALVGGPRSSCGNYNDKIDDYVANEVGVDYNAGINAAIGAYIYAANPPTPTVTRTFTRTETPNPLWTHTYTFTPSQTPTVTPVPPPTHKLNLRVKTSSGSSCTDVMRVQFRIYNYDTVDIGVSTVRIRVYTDSSASMYAESYNSQLYNPSGGSTGNPPFAYSVSSMGPCQESSSRVASKYVELGWTGTTVIPANGGYLHYEGVVRKGSSDWSALDPECNDYSRNETSWTDFVDNKYFSLYEGVNLVCEYSSATVFDPATGTNPCGGGTGCPGAVTATNTPVPPTATHTRTATRTNTHTYTFTRTSTYTNTVTRTFTHTFTRTSTPVPPTATNTASRTNTFTSTNTNTPVPPTSTFTHTGTSTFTRTSTNTATATRTHTHTRTSTNTPVPPTATDTATSTRTSTRTFTATSTNTSTATSTATSTDTATATSTYTVTHTATHTFTYTETMDPAGPTWTITETFTITDTPTDTSTFTRTYTATHTATATFTDTVTETETFTATDTFTPTETRTFTATVTDTATDTATETSTETFTATPTATQTFTDTATGMPTATNTGTATDTLIPTTTSTATDTSTGMPTATETFSAVNTPTDTATGMPTASATASMTQTWTNTASSTRTNTPSGTNTFTVTWTPTQTFTATSTNTSTYTITTIPSTSTYTPTTTRTAVDTPTPQPTESDTLAFSTVTPVIPFPNPPGKDGPVYFDFSLTKKADTVSIRVYSVASRLLCEKVITSAYGAGKNRVKLDREYFANFSPGAYYYVLTVKDASGQEARSKTGKLIILK